MPRPPSLLNLLINAPPSPIPLAAPLPLRELFVANARPAIAVPQPYLAALRKKPRWAVSIFNVVEDSQPPQATFADKTTLHVAVLSDSRVNRTPVAARVAYCYAV